MPRNPANGVFTRVADSFSNPIAGTIIDPSDAIIYYSDIDTALTNALPKEPSVFAADGPITAGTAAVAVQKASPTATALTLPSVLAQNGVPINLIDWSTGVTDHTITLTPAFGETIMRLANYSVYSNSAQLGSVTLYPSTVLNGWYV